MIKKFILYINSIEAEPKLTLFDLENFEQVSEKVITDKNQLSETILIEIDQILKKSNIKKSDLAAIVANVAPGSYTGARIGITTANFLAFSLDIPIFPTIDETLSKKYLSELKITGEFNAPVLPTYKAPPFITKSKG